MSQILGKAIGSSAMFFVSIMIARSFGAQGYGDFTKITTFVAFFYLFVDFGLNAIYLKRNADWSALLGMRILGGILLMFLAIAVLAFLPQGETQGYTGMVRLGIILYSPTILIQGLIVSANAIFQKHLLYDRATLALTVGSVVIVGLVWVAVYGLSSRVGVIGVTTSLLLGLSITAIVSLFFVRKIAGPIHISFDRKASKALFVAALPLGVTLLFNQVYFRVDSFILALTRSTSEVGYYGLAYKMFELPLVIPTFFMNSVYPLLLQTTSKQLIKRSFFVLLIASLLSLIAFWMAAPLLVYIRPEFAESIPLLRILTLGLPFFFLSSLVMWVLIALGKQIVLAGIYGSLMMITILLDILVIPKFGSIGAAWITVGSEALVLVASGIALRRLLQKI